MRNSQNDRHCCKILDRCFATVGRERGIRRCDKGRERYRETGGRPAERRAGGLKREEKNREKLVRATTAGRQRREGIFAGGKEESAGGVGGRVEVGVWIVDGTGCTARRCAALHLLRNGRYGGRGVLV